MILDSVQSTLESNGATAGARSFGMATNAKAFKILSDTIYTDKIGAVIRELCSNARDAHVAAGKKDVPFDVQLPTTLDPQFAVVDYGTGLSESDVYDLYSTYFSSNKDNSNDAIGCFGIGSKSPFAYVDGFTVISRFGGQKKTYMAYKEKDGSPAITLVSIEDYSGEPGLGVYMPVKVGNIQEFKTKFEKGMEFFEPKPNVNVPVVFAATNYVIRTSKFGLKPGAAYSMTGRVIQGGVAYPVHEGWFNASVDLFVEIGTVEVAASREALSLTPATEKRLREEYEAARRQYMTECKKHIGTLSNTFEAFKFIVNEAQKTAFLSAMKVSDFYDTYPNFTLGVDSGTILTSEWKNLSIDVFSSHRRAGDYRNHYHYDFNKLNERTPFQSFFTSSDIVFVINDLKSPHRFIGRYRNDEGKKTVVLLSGADAVRFIVEMNLTGVIEASALKEKYPDQRREYTRTARKWMVLRNGDWVEESKLPQDAVYVVCRYGNWDTMSQRDVYTKATAATLIFGSVPDIYVTTKPLASGIVFTEWLRQRIPQISKEEVENARLISDGTTVERYQRWIHSGKLPVSVRRLMAQVTRERDNKRKRAIRTLTDTYRTEETQNTKIVELFPLIEQLPDYKLDRYEDEILLYIRAKAKLAVN